MDAAKLLVYRLEPSALFLLGLATLLAIICYRRYLSPLSDIPGPFLASFSRLWHIVYILRGDQNVRIYELHKQYGPFVRISYDEVSVSHPDAPKQLLLTALEKGPFYSVGTIPDYRYRSTFSIRDPKAKMEHSKNFLPAYSLSNTLQSEPHVDVVWAKFLDWMDQFAQSKAPMDLDRFLNYATLDVVGEVLFSRAYGFLDAGTDIKGAIAGTKASNRFGAVVAYFPWLQLMMANPLVTWLNILPYGHLFDRATSAVREREKNSNNRFDILAHWMKRRQEYPDRLSEKELYAQITLNVGAGSDAVATGLQTFVYHMIRHPNAWKRAQEEIQDSLRQGRCQDRVISYADAQQLPYIQACIKEALRKFGAAGMGLPRVAGKGGVTIGSRVFPEGTVLSIHPYTMQIDEGIWGPDACEFNPDRWLAGDIATKEKYWLVFGLGYASCPGIHIAKVQLSKMAATMVRDYSIRQVEPGKPWKVIAYFNATPSDWPVFVEKSHVGMDGRMDLPGTAAADEV